MCPSACCRPTTKTVVKYQAAGAVSLRSRYCGRLVGARRVASRISAYSVNSRRARRLVGASWHQRPRMTFPRLSRMA